MRHLLISQGKVSAVGPATVVEIPVTGLADELRGLIFDCDVAGVIQGDVSGLGADLDFGFVAKGVGHEQTPPGPVHGQRPAAAAHGIRLAAPVLCTSFSLWSLVISYTSK